MQRDAALDLLARIFRMLEALRQREPGRGDASNIGVAEQRQDGVIEGSRRKLHQAALLRRTVRRQHATNEFALLAHDELLIVCRISAAFGDEGRDVWLLEKEFVEPGYLRENLQVGDVLRCE